MEEVKQSSAWVATHSSHVVVDSSGSFFFDSLFLFFVLVFKVNACECCLVWNVWQGLREQWRM